MSPCGGVLSRTAQHGAAGQSVIVFRELGQECAPDKTSSKLCDVYKHIDDTE